jgi:hypothetical protein
MLVILAGTRNHFALDLDRSVLGVIGVKIENAAQAVGLLTRAARSRELTNTTPRLGKDQHGNNTDKTVLPGTRRHAC